MAPSPREGQGPGRTPFTEPTGRSLSQIALSLCAEADSGYSEPNVNPGGSPWAFVFVDA